MGDQMLKNAGFKIESRNLDSQSGDIIESYWSEARSMRIIFLGKRVELEKYNFDKNLTRRGNRFCFKMGKRNKRI